MKTTYQAAHCQLSELKRRIATASNANPEPKKRWLAMKPIRWRLHSPQLGFWAGLSGFEIVPVTNPADAQTFDGRDNEDDKLAFYRQITGIHWQVQLVTP